MHFAVNQVMMQIGLKRVLDLRGGSIDRDPVLASSDGGNGKPLRFQPRSESCEIGIAQTKTLRVLFWRQPMTKTNRSRILLILQKLLEFCLL